MKRLYVCIVLMAAMLAGGAVSMRMLEEAQRQVDAQLAAIIEAAEQGDLETAEQESYELEVLWAECEGRLMHILRHNDLDTMSMSVNQLAHFARYEDQSMLLAQANMARKLNRHILESEYCNLHNIF